MSRQQLKRPALTWNRRINGVPILVWCLLSFLLTRTSPGQGCGLASLAESSQVFDGVPVTIHEVRDYPSEPLAKQTFNWDRFKKNPLMEVYFTIVRDNLLHKPKPRKLNVLDVLPNHPYDLIVGIDDAGHTALLIWNKETKRYNRFDSSVDVPSVFRPGYSKIGTGYLFAVEGLSQEALDKIYTEAKQVKSYSTCSQGVCNILHPAGVTVGSADDSQRIGGRGIPTSYQMFNALMKGSIFEGDRPLKVTRFSTDPQPLQDRYRDLLQSSRVYHIARSILHIADLSAGTGAGATAIARILKLVAHAQSSPQQ